MTLRKNGIALIAVLASTTAVLADSHDEGIVVMPGTPIASDPAMASRLEGRGVQFVGELLLAADTFSEPSDVPVELEIEDVFAIRLVEKERFSHRDDQVIVIGIDETSPGSRFTAFIKSDRLTRIEIRRQDSIIAFTAPTERGGALLFRVLIINPQMLRDELPPQEVGRAIGDDSRGIADSTRDEVAQTSNSGASETDDQNDPTASADADPLDPPTVVNVMVVYTEAAADDAFDFEGIDIEIIIEATVLVTSIDMQQQTNVTLNLVHVQEVPYVETGNIAEDLRRLECPCDIHEKDIGDNHLNEVFEPWRASGADIVSLWTYSPSEAGYGNIMATVDTEFAPRAVSVVDWWHAVYAYSFAHEIGHNFSARHDRAFDNTDGWPYYYNHGFVNYGQKQVTVMAYKKTCKSLGFFCTRHWYYSDPTMPPVNTWGLPSFMPLSADNAKALRASAPTIANLQSRSDLVGCCKKRGSIFFRTYEPGSCNW